MALLALLAAAGPPGLSRDKVIAYLWPENDEASARNTLKQVVYSLRRDLGSPDLIVGTGELRLNRDLVSVDLWELLDALERGELDMILELYSGPFLDGVFLTAAPEFERWGEQERASLAQRVANAIEAVARRATNERRFGQAVLLWRRLAALDPLNESRARSLVQALAANGDLAGALLYARNYETLLRAELEVEPPREWRALITGIRAARRSGLEEENTRETRESAAPQPAVEPVAAADSITTSQPAPDHSSAVTSGPAAGAASSGVASRKAVSSRRKRFLLVGAVGAIVVLGTAFAPTWYDPLRAWSAARAAHAALADWDMRRARSNLRTLIAIDSTRANAYLSLAEIAWWSDEPSAEDEQMRAATLALRYGGRLTMWERLRALALQASADHRWRDACRHFDALIAHDTTSFIDWYGRAECDAADAAVIRDKLSPSGWRFRTSYQTAISAYVRAFQLRPDFHRAFGGHAVKHLSRVLILQPNRARRGVADGPEPIEFAAFPAWEGDTIAFVPYSLRDIQQRRQGSSPTSTLEAIARNRETLRRLTALWTATSPESADAFEASALVLEMLGELDVARGGETAIHALERARRLAQTPEQQLRLAVTNVRFCVKSLRFAEARILTDSLLIAWPDPSATVAQWLAPLAALTGRPRIAARLQRTASPLAPAPVHGPVWSALPLPLSAAWQALVAYASIGVPRDSIVSTYNELESLIHLIEPAAQQAVRTALLQEPARFVAPLLPDSALQVVDTNSDAIAKMQLLLHRGNMEGVRRRMTTLQTARAHFRLLDRWPDAVLLEARIGLAAGDTAAVLGTVDAYVRALPVLNSGALDRVQTAASLPALLLLRSELARSSGDTATARRMRTYVESLWSEGEPEIRAFSRRPEP